MEQWQQRSRQECDARASTQMGGTVDTHIVAQWYRVGAELTLFEDGSVQLAGTAHVELLAHLLAEWHNHLKGKIA
jgi:hypothetical protein